MAQDLSPWHMFSASPQEESAFRLLSAHLAAQGQQVVLRGKPGDEQERYQQLFGVSAGVLTVDAHLAIDGADWYVDHTTVPLPGSAWMPSAMRAASDALNRLLACAVLLKHPARTSDSDRVNTDVINPLARVPIANNERE
ncbi:hypothetical protein ACFQ6N_19050 [Kitasatospora sp. NPDC056446]|uniref:hypothetical protein n=1 Tax=Kitasatospora sp. NPDC056446 TaxID=3345819 RepID=UPI0036738CB1